MRDYTKQPLKDTEIVEAFPDEQELVVEKLKEYYHEAAIIFQEVKRLHKMIDKAKNTNIEKWIFSNADKYRETSKLKWFYQQIKRLERLKVIYEKKRIERLLSKEHFETKKERELFDIDAMFARPQLLMDIILSDGINLRSKGSYGLALCPFHQEKTPSFAAYEDNWYHCFGCQKHGNFIDYLMLKHNLTFKEALIEANLFL